MHALLRRQPSNGAKKPRRGDLPQTDEYIARPMKGSSDVSTHMLQHRDSECRARLGAGLARGFAEARLAARLLLAARGAQGREALRRSRR